MKIYVFDLDGTIANLNHRLHFVTPPIDARVGAPKEVWEKHKDWKPNWTAFFDACADDEPIEWVINLMRMLRQLELLTGKVGVVLVLSGRSDRVRGITEDWMRQHRIPYDHLLMRREGDHRPDEIVKLEMLRDFLIPGEEYGAQVEVEFIVDDRQKVVDMWRREGFNVLQCNAWEETKKGSKV
jgi:hypothetical protein